MVLRTTIGINRSAGLEGWKVGRVFGHLAVSVPPANLPTVRTKSRRFMISVSPPAPARARVALLERPRCSDTSESDARGAESHRPAVPGESAGVTTRAPRQPGQRRRHQR